MIRARYSDFQAEIARVAGVSGMQITDPRVMAYTNSAIFELMNEGDWPSLIARLQFQLTQPRLILPSEFDRILYLTINHNPIPMQSPWYEFIGDGPDLVTSPWVANTPDQTLLFRRFVGVLDREQIYTFQDIPQDGNNYFPTIYGTADERDSNGNRPILTLLGYDSNGAWIRTNPGGVWQDGVQMPINGDTPPYSYQSPITFSQVTGVTKPVTQGYVQMYAVPQSAGTRTFLASYTPYDTVPYFRSYKIPGLENNLGNTFWIIARCRRRYVPIVNVADFLLISSLPALVAMVQAVYYREAKDPQAYAAYKAIAIDILRKEQTAYIGQQRTKPAITFGEGTGVRRDGMYIL